MSSTTTSDRSVVPPVLYLPCRPMVPGSQPEIELRQLEDGRVALLCYTALDRLARCCGPRQAWVLYQTADLSALRQQTPYDVVLLDHELPHELWQTEDDS